MKCMIFIRKFLFLCVFCCCIVGCSDQSQQKQAVSIPVPAIKILKSTIPLYKEYIGISQSIAQVEIRARVKGFLDSMNFVEGKPVKKDQLLFIIDPRPFQAKVDLAEGDLAKAKAEEAFQKVEYHRMQILVKKGDISQARHDQVEAQYKAAVGNVQVAQANLEEAKINLGYTSMYSPFDGIIGKRFVDVGNLVGGAEETVLANVVQLNPIYIEFSPSVNDFSEMLKYRNNMPFKVTAKFPHDENQSFKGTVDLINNEADISTSTILMRAIVENPKNLLLPGIYMNVWVLLTDSEKVILVPSNAVINNQGQQTVLVVNAKSLVETRKITTSGEYKQQFIVGSGLKEGDVVITEGIQKLRPGMQVDPKLSSNQDG